MADRVWQWTGRTADQLRAALRLTNEAFAEHLGVSARSVADWRRKPDMVPMNVAQQVLDTALEQAPEDVRRQFHEATGTGSSPTIEPSLGGAHRLVEDPHIGRALEWLDQAATWSAGQARAKVAAQLAELDSQALHDRGQRRAQVSQQQLVWALASYYGDAPEGYGRYGARIGDTETATTVLTSAEWLDLAAPLLGAADRLAVTTAPAPEPALDDSAAEQAVARLAEALTVNVQLVDMPLYRLDSTDVCAGSIGGQLGVDRFARYALTTDLLEAETVDALADNRPVAPGQLPLRDRYLPDFGAVLDVSNRLCAGGTLALCAIARPASLLRPRPDYVLMIQERSGRVLNAARRLAVIPKGFHQPMTDYRTDAQLGATLLREMEEELFGRSDIDNTIAEDRHADPMHPSRLSAPMRGLAESNALRIECTGFGYNLISGNYEFPGLIVIDDEQFWTEHGGALEANWEASGLRQVSTLDRDQVAELAGEIAWSNEGLFAYLQGLRRLAQLGGERVDLPAIEWELW
ncbi:hypothetical protein [Sciscionella marina]|uniref:hypothetical protein n=1 Tax=Sciscionella marina TaxID=508770 RepID=UPI00038219B0|nr:hypothetical protein [Sciscionella marina]